MKLSRTYLSISSAYILANKIIAFILLCVLLYPLFTKYLNVGFSCQHKIIFGTECRSCGLTRGLQSCMNFDFSTANKFNNQSTFIFITVICQLVFRFSFILISKSKIFFKNKSINTILPLDIFIIIILLIFNLKYYG